MVGTFVAFAGTYPDVASAEGDYQAVKELYDAVGVIDVFDAAVIGRKADGTVKIYKKHERPTGHGGWVGAGWGLATGLAVALFPAIGIGAVGWTAAAGAGLAAIAGHVNRRMTRDDLQRLGEVLDAGQAGLIVVAAGELRALVANAIRHAETMATTPLRADEATLLQELDDVRAVVAATG